MYRFMVEDLGIVGVDVGEGNDFTTLHLIEYKNGGIGCNYIISNVKKKTKIMTWEELEKIEAFLKENGYRKGDYPMHCNSDYYWWKSFGKDCNHYEEGRSLYQVLLNVYDWRKFWDRDPSLRKFNKAASITATVSVSRTIDEPSIALTWDLKNGVDLEDIEDKAYNFWRYVEDYFGVPPKE